MSVPTHQPLGPMYYKYQSPSCINYDNLDIRFSVDALE